MNNLHRGYLQFILDEPIDIETLKYGIRSMLDGHEIRIWYEEGWLEQLQGKALEEVEACLDIEPEPRDDWGEYADMQHDTRGGRL